MDRRIPFPVFGNSPSEYDRRFIDDLARKLNQLVTIIRTPGEGRNTKVVLTDLPTSDYGLEAGSLFQVDGVVRISLAYAPYLSGVMATGSVGAVSVTT